MKTIEAHTLKKMMDEEHDIILIDARTHEGFEEEHIPRAIKIPSNRLGQQIAGRYDRDRTIVTYCSSRSCESSTIAATKLDRFGFVNVLDFKGGLEEWKKAGYPTEGN